MYKIGKFYPLFQRQRSILGKYQLAGSYDDREKRAFLFMVDFALSDTEEKQL